MIQMNRDFVQDLSLNIHDAEDKKIAFEQYKIIVESLRNLNDTRESSNNFWVGLNSIALSGVSYLQGSTSFSEQNKPFLLWTIIVFGAALCVAWIFYLKALKKEVELKKVFLIKIERILPIPLYTQPYLLNKERRPSTSFLTDRELAVPFIFLSAYVLSAIALVFFAREIAQLF